MYKQLPRNSRSLPLEVTPQVFADEWVNCWRDPGRSTHTLSTMLEPFFSSWIHMLTTPGSKKDLGYIAFAQLLESNGVDPVEDLPAWVEFKVLEQSLKSELETIVYAQLRQLSYHPKKAYKLEYVISLDFRYRLSRQITRFFRRRVDVPSSASTFDILMHEDAQPDWLLIKNAGWSDWEEYLLMLHLRGVSSAYELSTNTRIPSSTIQREEETLWDRVRQLHWQQA